MVRTTEVRSDFPPLFYDELGRIAVAVGRIEYSLKLCIKDFMGEGFTAGMLIAEEIRNFSDLCTKAIALSDEKNEVESRVAFRNIVDRVRKLGSERNDMIHAFWTAREDRTPLRVRPERKKGIEAVTWDKTRPVTMEELSDLRRNLESGYAMLADYRQSPKLT